MNILKYASLVVPFLACSIAGCAVDPTPSASGTEQSSGHVAQANSVPGVLGANESIQRGQSLRSPGGRYVLTLQDDGNLVASTYYGAPVWASHTEGRAVSEAIMQSDGNFVLKDYAGQGIWGTGTSGKPDCTLVMQDDGNLVVYSRAARWASNTATTPSIVRTTPTHPDHLFVNQQLLPGQALQSSSGEYLLVLQADGNLVLARGTRGIWASHTDGLAVTAAVLQSDGNFVVNGYAHNGLWATGTQGTFGPALQLQDDGNLVLISSAGVWSSATHP